MLFPRSISLSLTAHDNGSVSKSGSNGENNSDSDNFVFI